MSLPKKIKIGHCVYTVYLVNRIQEGSWADVNYIKQEIRMVKDLSEQRRRECLLHECLHAVLESRITGSKEDKYSEELLVDQTTKGLIELMDNNPQLRKYLGWK